MPSTEIIQMLENFKLRSIENPALPAVHIVYPFPIMSFRLSL